MLFRDKLYNILSDLSKYKNSRSDLFSLRVQDRLDKALTSYVESVNTSYEYLSERDAMNVLKKLNKGK